MKMQEAIEREDFALCGMNCILCYRHLQGKHPCPGCSEEGMGRPISCQRCNILACSKERDNPCRDCPDFPCVWHWNLDRRYRRRYQISLIRRNERARTDGVLAVLRRTGSGGDATTGGSSISRIGCVANVARYIQHLPI